MSQKFLNLVLNMGGKQTEWLFHYTVENAKFSGDVKFKRKFGGLEKLHSDFVFEFVLFRFLVVFWEYPTNAMLF